MNDDYVSLEVAKLLKEKGFDWPCQAFYTNDGALIVSPVHTINDEIVGSDIACPTLYMAQKWLREEKNIEVVIIPVYHKERRFRFDIWNYEGLKGFIKPLKTSDGKHRKYEQCLNDAILEALEFI